MKNIYYIAEIGVNYYDIAKEKNISNMDAAKLMVSEAKRVGINAVKFQSYKAETLASKNSPSYWDRNEEPTETQYKLFQKFDKFGAAEYKELKDYCDEIDIDFLSTPFDFDSADYLENMVDIYKISSSDLTNDPFLAHIAKKGKPVYLSTGASYLSEIDHAIQVLENNGCPKIVLMHCVLSYPTKDENANLLMIKDLKEKYPNYKIGYSDHTRPGEIMLPSLLAYLNGAEVIEKHYTLDKTLKGNDHYHAMDPNDFLIFKKHLENLKNLMGEKNKTVLEIEQVSRANARRSIIAKHNIKKGTTISLEDLTYKRPGTGISPTRVKDIIGLVTKKDIEEDTALEWEMFDKDE